MKERRFRLIIFIVVLSFGKSPKSKRICTPHQENILEHLKNSEGTYGAAADFCPLNFLVGTLHLGLHGQEQHFDVKGKPDGCQFHTCDNNQSAGEKMRGWRGNYKGKERKPFNASAAEKNLGTGAGE